MDRANADLAKIVRARNLIISSMTGLDSEAKNITIRPAIALTKICLGGVDPKNSIPQISKIDIGFFYFIAI